MTIEEKAKKIMEWCEDQDECEKCCLQGRPTCYSCFNEETRAVVEANYAIVFGNEAEAVNHPNHYQGKNECIDVMIAMFGKEAVKHFCMCNAYKYRFRADKKNGEEDIEKAEFYETYLINMGGIDGESSGGKD